MSRLIDRYLFFEIGSVYRLIKEKRDEPAHGNTPVIQPRNVHHYRTCIIECPRQKGGGTAFQLKVTETWTTDELSKSVFNQPLPTDSPVSFQGSFTRQVPERLRYSTALSSGPCMPGHRREPIGAHLPGGSADPVFARLLWRQGRDGDWIGGSEKEHDRNGFNRSERGNVWNDIMTSVTRRLISSCLFNCSTALFKRYVEGRRLNLTRSGW